MTYSLIASKKKVERAERKLRHLVTLVNGYNQSTPYHIFPKDYADGTGIIARRVKDPPDDIAWELVEAIGHLRGALDKMVVTWVEKAGRGMSGVGFPFGGLDNGKPREFPGKRVEKGIKEKLSADQWTLIESQRPYPGGNDTLWAVNEIANMDKHREGLVTACPAIGANSLGIGAAIPGVSITNFVSTDTADYDFLVQDKERETVLVVASGFNLKVDCGVTSFIVFGNVKPIQGRNVLTTLSEQIGLVKSILSAGEALL